MSIVEAIAAAKGVDPLNLGYALADYIDTEAINALASSRDSEWSLRFTIPNHTVTIDSEGTITVDGTEYR